MRVVHRTALVPQTPAQMYALVNDVRRYPEFLPWCPATVVHAEDATSLSATLTFERVGVRTSVSTTNRNVPDTSIEMVLTDGPLKSFKGVWQFHPLRARTEDGSLGALKGCKVELTVEFTFRNAALDLVFGPFFEATWDSIVDGFVKRARIIHP
jgi:ribosome-associated toxin RatA of RatAB toxin-antitoxin module